MLLTPNFMKIHTSAASGLISLPALVVEAASLIGKETDERRILQRRTISIERLTSNVDSMYSVCLKKRFREAIPHFEVLGRSRRAGAPAAPAPRVSLHLFIKEDMVRAISAIPDKAYPKISSALSTICAPMGIAEVAAGDGALHT